MSDFVGGWLRTLLARFLDDYPTVKRSQIGKRIVNKATTCT